MVLDILSAVGIGIAAGGGAGALASYLGYRSGGGPFDNGRLIGALATGIIAGVTLVFMNLAAFKTSVVDETGFAFVELLGTIVLATLGVDFFRNKVSAIVANRSPEPLPPPTG